MGRNTRHTRNAARQSPLQRWWPLPSTVAATSVVGQFRLAALARHTSWTWRPGTSCVVGALRCRFSKPWTHKIPSLCDEWLAPLIGLAHSYEQALELAESLLDALERDKRMPTPSQRAAARSTLAGLSARLTAVRLQIAGLLEGSGAAS